MVSSLSEAVHNDPPLQDLNISDVVEETSDESRSNTSHYVADNHAHDQLSQTSGVQETSVGELADDELASLASLGAERELPPWVVHSPEESRKAETSPTSRDLGVETSR
jgi:hypothetical protein